MIRALLAAGALLALNSPSWARIALNPDVTQNRIAQTICVPGYTKTVRPSTTYTNGVKRNRCARPGVPNPTSPNTNSITSSL